MRARHVVVGVTTMLVIAALYLMWGVTWNAGQSRSYIRLQFRNGLFFVVFFDACLCLLFIDDTVR